MNGAATNPDFHVLAHGAAQVKAALDATIALGGENYVFWGGREGYMSLLNTNMKREKEHFARFLHTAKDYARKNGFKGKFFIEPKPCEPSKHQYDYDSETVIGFCSSAPLNAPARSSLTMTDTGIARSVGNSNGSASTMITLGPSPTRSRQSFDKWSAISTLSELWFR